MNEVLITGSSSGIGKELSEYFLNKEFKVYGIARRNQDFFKNKNFESIQMDLNEPNLIEKSISNYNFSNLNTLILNAGIGYFAPFESIPTKKIQEILNINTISPMILTRLLISNLLKNSGKIIIISSISAEMISRWGSVYSTSKMAITQFGRLLIDEYKNQNLGISILSPDIVNTEFYDNLVISPSNDPDAFLKTEDIVGVIDFILSNSNHSNISELKIKPKKFEIQKKKFLHSKTES
jgi:short-subunit dehydrogenase